jgi:putative nucleotidyltransferase with HDIG domain
MILSEHSEEEFTLRALDVAHQLIARPCDGAILVKTITRTLELRSTFENASLLKLIAETAGLPALPRSYSQLCARLRDPNCTIDDLVHWIEEDPALSLSLLRIANSAFFGRFRTVSGIREAVLLVGTRTLRNLVLAEGAFSSIEEVPAEQRGTVQSVYSHSVQVARVAARMLPPGPGRDQAFAAGLLHDVGKLLLATRRADLWTELQRRGASTSASAHDLERDLVGVSHAEIGGYLLALWGLPHPVVEAVTWHHDPARYGAGTVDPSIAVIVANALVHSVASGSDGAAAEIPPQVEELLAVRCLESRMEEWRDIAANLHREAA